LNHYELVVDVARNRDPARPGTPQQPHHKARGQG
jgi:hypothetical protein